MFIGTVKNCFNFSCFACFHRPLLVDVDIYTTTLILYNSINYNLIDTKLGTQVHLFILYQPSKLATWSEKILYQCCMHDIVL